MKALVQRVDHASVSVDGEVVGRIGVGLLTLIGAGRADTGADAVALARKVVGLRIFPDDDGRFNRSLVDVGGAMLVVSQFTPVCRCPPRQASELHRGGPARAG